MPKANIRVGDLVSVQFTSELCQVITIDDEAVIVAPLINLENGKIPAAGKRHAANLNECERIPTPPLPVPDFATHPAKEDQQ